MGKSTSLFVAALIAVVGSGAAHEAFAVTPIGGLGNAQHVVIWVPDYYGRNVFKYTFDYASGNGAVFSQTVLKLPTSGSSGGCNPNAVTMQNNELYIVCNSAFGRSDEVLVYNTSTHHYKQITGTATDGRNYFTGSQLIAILFDSHGNLWVSGYRTNDLLRVPANQLGKATPEIDRQVINSPDSPAGLAMDTDKSIWVVGQYNGGIVLNFPDDVLNAPGTFLGSTALNPTPSFCIANGAPGCQQNVPNLFNNPEGVAVFDKAIWISNNGGNAPARTIVRLAKDKDELTHATFGDNLNKPFACPGGMFALPAPSGGQASLWVNDEGYDDPHTPKTCGATQSDQGSHVGRVLQFLADDLTQHQSNPKPVQFTDWNKITTSSPGFGGIFVQAY